MISSDARYSSTVTYAPGLIAALYKTGLQSAFSINRIYAVLTQPTCTVCNRFGGYVFLPGLQRCCQRCALNDFDLTPITLPNAHLEYKINTKSAINIPKMLVSSDNYKGHSALWACSKLEGSSIISRVEAERAGASRCDIRHHMSRRRAPDFNLGVMPLPWLESAGFYGATAIDRGYHCLGCARAACPGQYRGDCYHGCQACLPKGVDVPYSSDFIWPGTGGTRACKTALDRERLYSKTEILSHITQCLNAQDYLADLGIEMNRPPYVKQKPKKMSKKRRNMRTDDSRR